MESQTPMRRIPLVSDDESWITVSIHTPYLVSRVVWKCAIGELQR